MTEARHRSLDDLRTGDLLNAALRDAGLLCDSPMNQFGLYPNSKISIRADECDAINRYDFRDEKVFCHACGRLNHYRGMTVSFKGNLALIGNCCAEKYFGTESFKKIDGGLRRHEEAVYHRRFIQPIEMQAVKIRSGLEDTEHICAELDRTINKMREESPDLFNVLENVVLNQNGRLIIDVAIRSETNRHAKQQKKIPKILGYLKGGSAILKQDLLTRARNKVRAELSTLARFIERRPSTKLELQEMLSMYRATRSDFVRLHESIQDACFFLARENLHLIRQYALEAGFKAQVRTRQGLRPLFSNVPVAFEMPKIDLPEPPLDSP